MTRAISKAAFFSKIGYRPHPTQMLYHQSTARFRFPNCGRRFGKSTMAARDAEPELFLPERLYWIVGPTYDLGEKEFRYIWHDLIVRQRMGRDKRIKRAYSKKQGNMFIEFPWHTRIEVRSADHPENLVGDALHGVIMSEAAKHKKETWERFIRPALADYRGWATFPTTPEGYNWIYDLWMLGQDPSIPEYQSWRFPSWENSEIYPLGFDDPEIQLLKRTMSPEAFAQEIGADFGSFVGKIYPEWDLQQHVTSVKFNPMWPNYIAFDWGYTNPLAAIEFQVSPSDEVFIWREHYKAYERVERHCQILKEREQPYGYHLDLAFGDAADPEATDTVSRNLVQCVSDPRAKSGIREASKPEAGWRDGIDLVRSFMEREMGEDEFGGPIYGPAFHVDHSCVNTIREFNNYKAPDSVNGKNVQEIGIRQDDHALDAIRYGLMHVFKLGATHHLSEVVELTVPLGARGTFNASELELPVGNGGFFTTGGEF